MQSRDVVVAFGGTLEDYPALGRSALEEGLAMVLGRDVMVEIAVDVEELVAVRRRALDALRLGRFPAWREFGA